MRLRVFSARRVNVSGVLACLVSCGEDPLAHVRAVTGPGTGFDLTCLIGLWKHPKM